MIENNGQVIFDLIGYFLGKIPNFKHRITDAYQAMRNGQDQKNNFYMQILDQYDEIINFLKENGALLNTIRP